MNRNYFFLILPVFLILSWSYFDRGTFHISNNSKLEILGTTNVNKFTCVCREQIQPRSFKLEKTANRNVLHFKDTSLKIKINTLDCGNNMMNKDLQKAMNADTYPFVEIELKEIIQDHCNPLNEFKDWVKITALTNISLNGNSNKYTLEVKANKFSKNKFRFLAAKTLTMSDFCIEPPTAMMGMVKVRDEIKINLDLEITVDQ